MHFCAERTADAPKCGMSAFGPLEGVPLKGVMTGSRRPS